MYAEELPEECPPPHAEDVELGIVWRFVSGPDATAADFLSHAALGKPCANGADECRWASCSLIPTEDAMRAKAKLPGLRTKTPIKIQIPLGSGRSISTAQHIDFWRYVGFDPLENLIKEAE